MRAVGPEMAARVARAELEAPTINGDPIHIMDEGELSYMMDYGQGCRERDGLARGAPGCVCGDGLFVHMPRSKFPPWKAIILS